MGIKKTLSEIRQDQRIRKWKESIHGKPKRKKKRRKTKDYSKLSYSALLRKPEWKNKRELILKRDNYTCQICGFGLNLEVHHKRYIKGRYPWEYKDDDLITLCEICHAKEHNRI